jgi:uncharacterized protein (DUF983 family)
MEMTDDYPYSQAAPQGISQLQPLPVFSVRDFFKRFPDDDAYLENVMEVRYGLRHTCSPCGESATFNRLAKRKAYSCSRCGAHVYPCAGTVFQDSRYAADRLALCHLPVRGHSARCLRQGATAPAWHHLLRRPGGRATRGGGGKGGRRWLLAKAVRLRANVT